MTVFSHTTPAPSYPHGPGPDGMSAETTRWWAERHAAGLSNGSLSAACAAAVAEWDTPT